MLNEISLSLAVHMFRMSARVVISRTSTFRVSAAALLFASVAACSPRSPGSAAIDQMFGKRAESNRGMVSASHPDAAAAGAEALGLGGNAVDAAVATGFALSVVDVSQTGLGGGGALTFYDAKARRAEHPALLSTIGCRRCVDAGGYLSRKEYGSSGRCSGNGCRSSRSTSAMGKAHSRSGDDAGNQTRARRLRRLSTTCPLHCKLVREIGFRLVGESEVHAGR